MSGEEGVRGVISILLMGFGAGDRDLLSGFFASPEWEVRDVSSCREAVQALDEQGFGVCICAGAMEDGDWRSVLAGFERRADAPNLIVTSRLADERLWAEVLNLGGYDVLAQPFDRDEVLRVAFLAGAMWRRGGRLQQAHAAS
ncbi:MAG TPA: response regulator [Bryobacteraceae bacterium]|nr:response regulator [Bryobacteraceae bacterium]